MQRSRQVINSVDAPPEELQKPRPHVLEATGEASDKAIAKPAGTGEGARPPLSLSRSRGDSPPEPEHDERPARNLPPVRRGLSFKQMVGLLVGVGIIIGAGCYQVSQMLGLSGSGKSKPTSVGKPPVAKPSRERQIGQQVEKGPAIEAVPKWQKANKRGLEAEKAGNFEKALSEFSSALDMEPDRPEILHSRGRALAGLEQYVRAAEDFSKALETSKIPNEILLDRAAAYFHSGDSKKAIKDYNRIIKNDSSYAKAYYGRGLTYMKLRDFDRAIKDFQEVTRLMPSYASAYKQQGLIYSDRGKKDDALAVLSQGIEQNKNSAELFYERGLVNYDLGKRDEAVEDFSRAIELEPGKKEFLNDRGFVYLQLKRYSEAVADFEQCLSIDQSYNLARENLAKAREAMSRQ